MAWRHAAGPETRAHLPSADLLAQALRVAGVARLHHAGQNALLQAVVQDFTFGFSTNPENLLHSGARVTILRAMLSLPTDRGQRAGQRSPRHSRQRTLDPKP